MWPYFSRRVSYSYIQLATTSMYQWVIYRLAASLTEKLKQISRDQPNNYNETKSGPVHAKAAPESQIAIDRGVRLLFCIHAGHGHRFTVW